MSLSVHWRRGLTEVLSEYNTHYCKGPGLLLAAPCKPKSLTNASLQSLAERFRRLPGLFVADMGIAHGRADILVAEQFLDFPQILSHLVEEDRGRGVAQPMRCDLPDPEGSTGGPQPQVEPRLENGAPEYPANTNCNPAKFIPPGAMIRRPLNSSWRVFHSRSAALKRPGTGTSRSPFPLMRRATISSPTLWQSLQVSWMSSSNRQAVWKRALAKWNARAEPYPCCRTLR
jgi:hypothetical protein